MELATSSVGDGSPPSLRRSSIRIRHQLHLEPQLYRIYDVQLERVMLEPGSLHTRASFLMVLGSEIDAQNRVFAWIGRESRKVDQAIAQSLGPAILAKDLKSDTGEFITIRQRADAKADPEEEQFWNTLGVNYLKAGVLENFTISMIGADLTFGGYSLHKLKRKRGWLKKKGESMQWSKIAVVKGGSGCFSKDALQSDAALLLVCPREVHLWLGKAISEEIRQCAKDRAEEIVAGKNDCILLRQREGREMALFMHRFTEVTSDSLPETPRPECHQGAHLSRSIRKGGAPSLEEEVEKMNNPLRGSLGMGTRNAGEPQALGKSMALLHNAGSVLTVYGVTEDGQMSLSNLDDLSFGIFYSDEAYLVEYTSPIDNAYMIFGWCGRHCSHELATTLSIIAVERKERIIMEAEELSGSEVDVSLIYAAQGRESPFFKALFSNSDRPLLMFTELIESPSGSRMGLTDDGDEELSLGDWGRTGASRGSTKSERLKDAPVEMFAVTLSSVVSSGEPSSAHTVSSTSDAETLVDDDTLQLALPRVFIFCTRRSSLFPEAVWTEQVCERAVAETGLQSCYCYTIVKVLGTNVVDTFVWFGSEAATQLRVTTAALCSSKGTLLTALAQLGVVYDTTSLLLAALAGTPEEPAGSFISVESGREPAEFWDVMKCVGVDTLAPAGPNTGGIERPVRLFRVLSEERRRGRPYVFEIGMGETYLQTDLVSTDACILDGGGNYVYVWHGEQSSLEQSKLSAVVARMYADSLGVNVDVTQVLSGDEPGHFIGHFSMWEMDLFNSRRELGFDANALTTEDLARKKPMICVKACISSPKIQHSASASNLSGELSPHEGELSPSRSKRKHSIFDMDAMDPAEVGVILNADGDLIGPVTVMTGAGPVVVCPRAQYKANQKAERERAKEVQDGGATGVKKSKKRSGQYGSDDSVLRILHTKSSSFRQAVQVMNPLVGLDLPREQVESPSTVLGGRSDCVDSTYSHGAPFSPNSVTSGATFASAPNQRNSVLRYPVVPPAESLPTPVVKKDAKRTPELSPFLDLAGGSMYLPELVWLCEAVSKVLALPCGLKLFSLLTGLFGTLALCFIGAMYLSWFNGTIECTEPSPSYSSLHLSVIQYQGEGPYGRGGSYFDISTLAGYASVMTAASGAVGALACCIACFCCFQLSRNKKALGNVRYVRMLSRGSALIGIFGAAVGSVVLPISVHKAFGTGSVGKLLSVEETTTLYSLNDCVTYVGEGYGYMVFCMATILMMLLGVVLSIDMEVLDAAVMRSLPHESHCDCHVCLKRGALAV
ncbi:unnamed protein product [Chrysoparadoxa australica]